MRTNRDFDRSYAVEEALWAVMAGADSFGTTSSAGSIDAATLTTDTATDRDQGTML